LEVSVSDTRANAAKSRVCITHFDILSRNFEAKLGIKGV